MHRTQRDAATQVPRMARMEAMFLQAGMGPMEARAAAMRMTPGGANGLPGLGGPTPGVQGPPPLAQANPGVAAGRQAEGEIYLINNAPQVLEALKRETSADGALGYLSGSGLDFSRDPRLAAALRGNILGRFGQQGVDQATASATAPGWAANMGLVAPEGAMMGLPLGRDISSMPRPLRMVVQPFNYLFGGPGTSPIGDPNEQVRQRGQQASLWRRLSGQP